MFPVSQKNAVRYLTSPWLSECDFLVHAFCTRLGGGSQDDYHSLNMSFSEGDEEFRVLGNWNRLSVAFDIPMEHFLVLNQVHGDSVFVIRPHGEYFESREKLDYDAIVTNRPNVAICIKTADCVPVFIVDRVKKVIGVVHAGWRGTALGIAAKVVWTMREKYASDPRDLLASIGPSIGPCCYEVDRTVAEAFSRQSGCDLFLRQGKRKGHWMLDLAEANRRQLEQTLIPAAQIDTAGWCTMCRQDTFFSHRGAGGITGRQVSFMMIKGEAFCRALLMDENPSFPH